MIQDSTAKRKQPGYSDSPQDAGRDVKRVKHRDARSILAQTSDKALSKNGDLDVPSFVKAREFEIRAVEASIGASKKALASRAFQELPKDLRRRTASHNVKRVPRRVRARAQKEVSFIPVPSYYSLLKTNRNSDECRQYSNCPSSSTEAHPSYASSS